MPKLKKKKKRTTDVNGMNVGKRNTHGWWGYEVVESCWKSMWMLLKILAIDCLAILLWGHVPYRLHSTTEIVGHSCSLLIMMAREWESPRRPSMGGCILKCATFIQRDNT